jgi:hypothetical protein
MAQLAVMYKTPRDAAAFDKHYAEMHRRTRRSVACASEPRGRQRLRGRGRHEQLLSTVAPEKSADRAKKASVILVPSLCFSVA